MEKTVKVVDAAADYSIVVADINKKMLLDDCVTKIVKSSSQVVTGFCHIGKELKTIRDQELYRFAGYDDVYAFSEAMFGYKETSTKNFIGLFDRFCEIQYGDAVLKADFKEYSLTQLVELLPVDDHELSNYKPSMKVKDIRVDKKVSRLTDDVHTLEKLVIKEIKALKLGNGYELKDCFLRTIDSADFHDDNVLVKLYTEFTFGLSLRLAYVIRCKHDRWNKVVNFYANRVEVPGFKIPENVYSSVSDTESLSKFVKEFKKEILDVGKQISDLISEAASKKSASSKAESSESLLPCTLKNDKLRDAHVRDAANWTFVEHIDFLDIDIYKFNTVDGYFRFDKKHLKEDSKTESQDEAEEVELVGESGDADEDGECEEDYEDDSDGSSDVPGVSSEYYEFFDGDYGIGYCSSSISNIVCKLKELRV